MYVRTINSFLSWLKEDGRIEQRLKVKLLRAPQHLITLLSAGDLRALLLYKPRTVSERRTWTLILLLLDTGLRIDEALGLERSRVNLDGMVIAVSGKGGKERQVPISLELRKVLYRWTRTVEGPISPLVFASRSGLRLLYRNVTRDIQDVCQRSGIIAHVHPHLFRHQFAATYIRQGGDIYRLSRLLGHTAITTTQLYLRSMGVEDLRAGKERLTPLRLER
jgi:integrase/recombinase XerD